MKQLVLISLLACMADNLAAAEFCSKSSPAHVVALLELYTSEGCNSCPPADRAISTLYQDTGLNGGQVIPLSLHVDYWDDLGWKDVFAKPAYSERQRNLASLTGSRSVYTPEVFLSGKELRNWRYGMADEIKRINQKPATASLRLGIEKLVDHQLYLNLQANSAQEARVYVALVEQGITSHVQAGENRGATLHHDFVAREWSATYQLPAGKLANYAAKISIPADAKKKNLSVLAFAQDQQGNILQALNLPLCETLQ